MTKPWVLVGGPVRYSLNFQKKYPMRNGRFPKDHPCADDPHPMVMGKYRQQIAEGMWVEVPGERPQSDTALGKLRAIGFWASCYPEGDGITIERLCVGDAEQLAEAIEKCFGVKVRRMCE